MPADPLAAQDKPEERIGGEPEDKKHPEEKCTVMEWIRNGCEFPEKAGAVRQRRCAMTALDYLREAKVDLTPEEQRMCDDFALGVLSLHVPQQVWRDAWRAAGNKGKSRDTLRDSLRWLALILSAEV